MADEPTTLFDNPTAEATPAAPVEGVTAAPSETAAPETTTTQPADTPAPAPAPTAGLPSKTEQHLEAIRRALESAKTSTAPQPESYSAEQLQTHKVSMLREMAKSQAAGDEVSAEKYARTVAWCDDKLMEQRLGSAKKEWGQSSAVQQLRAGGMKILEPYKQELVEGTPLFQQANSVYGSLVTAGYPDGDLTGMLAAIMALQASGRSTQGLVTQTRVDLTKDMQTKLKQSAIAGAGGANPTASGPSTAADIWSMSDQEFAKYSQSMRGH